MNSRFSNMLAMSNLIRPFRLTHQMRNLFLICALIPSLMTQAQKWHLPEESAGIDSIARTLVSLFNQADIIELEAGLSNPSYMTLLKIADALDTNLKEFDPKIDRKYLKSLRCSQNKKLSFWILMVIST